MTRRSLLAAATLPAFALQDKLIPVDEAGYAKLVAAQKGKVLLVNFWATWCQPCRASFPEYQALLASYGDRVMVVGISEDDEQEGIQRFADETGARFPLGWDADKSVAQRYQINSMPTLFIIDPSGLVRYVHAGFRAGDEASIRAAIDSLL